MTDRDMKKPTFKDRFLRMSSVAVRNDFLVAALVTVCVIMLGTAIGWENNKVIPANPDPTVHYSQTRGQKLTFLSNWDGPDYLRIAEHGYQDIYDSSFFPLYPLTVHIVAAVVDSYLYSGLFVAWAALVGAAYYYLKIVKQVFKLKDNAEAVRALMLFMLFPTALFLFVTYTESLFALFSLAAIYYALKSRFILSAALALFATAAHFNGIFIVAFIALIAFEQRIELRKIIGIIVIGCIGLIGYMTYLQHRFNNMFAFVTAQHVHGWLRYGYSDFFHDYVSLNGLFILTAISATIYWWPRRKSFALYSFFYLSIPLLGGVGAYGRYALMIFPFQFMLYDKFRKNQLGYAAIMAIFGVFWAFFMLQFAAGYSGG